MDLHNGWNYDGAGFRNSFCGSSGGIKIMFKSILVGAALFAAPAMAQTMEPENALMGIVRMETAEQFCGLPHRRDLLRELLMVVLPHVKLSTDEFTDSVRRAAKDMGEGLQQTGSLPGFCASVGEIYGRYGR